MEYISKNEKETSRIARKIFLQSDFGDIYALCGDLGSGKTVFVRSFARAAGIKQAITSPTFVIMKRYLLPSSTPTKKKHLVHVDCYRMAGEDDAKSIGLQEYFNTDNIVLIEWPEKILSILPQKTKYLKFEYVDENTRKIIVK